MDFPCRKCGLCCKMLQDIPILSDYDIGNGTCRYLKNNLCSIYENRPILCNVERMYSNYFKDSISEKDYIKININACSQIIDFFDKNSNKHELINKHRH